MGLGSKKSFGGSSEGGVAASLEQLAERLENSGTKILKYHKNMNILRMEISFAQNAGMVLTELVLTSREQLISTPLVCLAAFACSFL